MCNDLLGQYLFDGGVVPAPIGEAVDPVLVNVTAETSGGVSGLRLQFSRPIVGKSAGSSALERALYGTSTSSIRLRPYMLGGARWPCADVAFTHDYIAAASTTATFWVRRVIHGCFRVSAAGCHPN